MRRILADENNQKSAQICLIRQIRGLLHWRCCLRIFLILAILLAVLTPGSGRAQDATPAAVDAAVATAWSDLLLELVRSSPGFTPPVASRAMGYLGVTLWEAVAPGIPGAQSLAGRLNEMPQMPRTVDGAGYDLSLIHI